MGKNHVKSAPHFVGDNSWQVSRLFEKRANIFGTTEYRMWQELRSEHPDAVMVVRHNTRENNPLAKPVKKKPGYISYKQMAEFFALKGEEEEEKLLALYQKIYSQSKIARNPRKFMTNTFIEQFEDDDLFKAIFIDGKVTPSIVPSANHAIEIN